jgi:hypothetical protein
MKKDSERIEALRRSLGVVEVVGVEREKDRRRREREPSE